MRRPPAARYAAWPGLRETAPVGRAGQAESEQAEIALRVLLSRTASGELGMADIVDARRTLVRARRSAATDPSIQSGSAGRRGVMARP